ncbi:hypothetical protein JCM6882_007657 [Rhodosporidiobolus microsporus]
MIHSFQDGTQAKDPAQDIADREERLTSLLQVLGFPSLDHLEDFILLHGSAKLVPTSSLSNNPNSLPLDETQATSAGGTHYDETARARRHHERRVENAALKRENEQVRNEVKWARGERQADQVALDELRSDKKRLLDRVEGLLRENEQLRSSSGAGLGAVSSSLSTSTTDGAGPSTQAQLQSCYDDIADLEATVGQLEGEVQQLTEQLEAALEKGDELAVSLRSAEEDVAAARREREEKESELQGFRAQLKVMLEGPASERRASTAHADVAMEDVQKQQPSSVTVASDLLSPAPAPASSIPPSSNRAPVIVTQLRGPPAPSPFQPSPRTNRASRLSASMTASPAPLPSVAIKPAAPDASAAAPPALPPTATAASVHPRPTAAAVAPPRPTAIPPHIAASSRPSASSAPSASSSSSAGAPPAASATPRNPSTPSSGPPAATIPPTQRQTQVKLLPQLFSSYKAHRAALVAAQPRLATALERLARVGAEEGEDGRAFVQKVEKKYIDRPVLFDSPEGEGSETAYPPEPWAAYGFLPSLSAEELKQRAHALVQTEEGAKTFKELFERVKVDEEALEKRVVGTKAWCEGIEGELKRREKKAAKAKAAAKVNGAAKSTAPAVVPAKRVAEVDSAAPSSSSAVGTPGAKGQPVKKRRKVVKPSSGVATPSAAGVFAPKPPLPAVAAPSPAPAPQHTTTTPRLAPTALPPTSALPPAAAAAFASAAAATTGPPSSKGKKRWNLVSPTKRNAATPVRSPSAAAAAASRGKSPAKLNLNLNKPSPARAAAAAANGSPAAAAAVPSSPRKVKAAMLVDDTQQPSFVSHRPPPPAAPLFVPAVAAPPPPAAARPAPPARRSSSTHSSSRAEETPRSGSHTPHPSTYEPEPDTLVTVVGAVGDAGGGGGGRGRSSSVTAVASARSSSRSPLKTAKKPLPRRTSSVAPQARRMPQAANEEEDDPFTVRAPPAATAEKGKGVFALRPSPNARTRTRTRSTSASPSKRDAKSPAGGSPFHPPPRSSSGSPSPSKSAAGSYPFAFEMPPSAQPAAKRAGAKALGRREHEEESDEEEEEGTSGYKTELRFFAGMSPPLPPPKKAKATGEGKKAKGEEGKRGKKRPAPEPELERVKEEPESLHAGALAGASSDEEDDDGEDAGDFESTSPPRTARRGGASKGKGKKARRSAARDDVDAVDEDEEGAGDSDLDMPPYPADEKGRKMWHRLLPKRRKERDERKARRSMGGGEGGKGSTAASTSTRAIELNPDRNKGEKHHFKEVVRNKAERAKMLAEACESCSSYYNRAGKSAPAGACKHVHPQGGGGEKGWLDMRHEQIESRLQDLGRHRVQQRTEPDPLHFWQFGMPDTQQQEEINEDAKQRKAEKRAYQEAQAEQANGFYRYRREGDEDD